jgi:ABC-type Zn uptake system ZnuABC Zn-binding protein ZnuA
MVTLAKKDGVKAVLCENYYDTRSDELVSRLSGAKQVTIPGDVGGDPAAASYEAYLDLLVRRVTEALQ